MLYFLFLILAIAYNLKKFRKERETFLASLIEAKHTSHRQMILGHHFYIFIFEGFISLIVAHLVTGRANSIGILGLATVYLGLVFFGFFIYQFFIRYIEKHTRLQLYSDFKNHLIKELRVNFAMIMVPILVYSLINWAFQDNIQEESGSLWFVKIILNIIFVSVLSIVCSVIIMLRLIPNREITEPEYLEIINKRLSQIQQTNIRIRWIETDIKNAFVVGLKLLRFSNQTMFIGRSLRTTLTLEEFDAVIAHELSHVANRHIHKRVIDLLKNFISVILGTAFFMFVIFGLSALYWGEDAFIHSGVTTFWCVGFCLAWMFYNYSVLFDTIRSHEYEADGYAVIVLGASFTAFKSALEKLTTTEELPNYIKQRTNKNQKKNFVAKWLSKNFSTHPELSARVSFLEYKIASGLPFNYYVTAPQKLRNWLGYVLHWRVSLPLTTLFLCTVSWGAWNLRQGILAVRYVNTAPIEEIMKNETISKNINSRPHLIGQSLMYFIVLKKDDNLIDHFVSKGADKGKTLLYISQTKNYELFEKYYSRFQNQLTDDEYFVVLKRTAQVNFSDGYRLLVNARRFDDLNPTYKENVSRIFENNQTRWPASIKK